MSDRDMRPPEVQTIIIPPSMHDALIAHLRAALPNEGCALIAGEVVGRSVMAHKLYPGTNVDHSPTRFTMDAVQVLSAWREMQDRGWILAAIAHSHPGSPATPSPTDLAEAYYPESVGIIVSWVVDPPEVRAWSYAQHPPREITMVVQDRDVGPL